jgi:dihydrofolate reductase
MSVSLDGFVADDDDHVEGVFSWYAKPQPEPSPDEPEGDGAIKGAVGMRNELGALIYGRRTFEIAKGWGGTHPTGAPVIVVSHSVPDGWPRPDGQVRFAASIDEALEMARILADDKVIAIATPSIVQQLLDRGELDGVRLSVVPVLLGGGTRYFANLAAAPIDLDGPIVAPGNGVTHLYYAVRR